MKSAEPELMHNRRSIQPIANIVSTYILGLLYQFQKNMACNC
jgi:hypothetical protein